MNRIDLDNLAEVWGFIMRHGGTDQGAVVEDKAQWNNRAEGSSSIVQFEDGARLEIWTDYEPDWSEVTAGEGLIVRFYGYEEGDEDDESD